MKLKLMLIAGSILLCSGLMTACTREQDTSYSESIPTATEPETDSVPDDPNAEFMDAPETAPIIIDPDAVPETEPPTEIFNDAPEIMPEN